MEHIITLAFALLCIRLLRTTSKRNNKKPVRNRWYATLIMYLVIYLVLRPWIRCPSPMGINPQHEKEKSQKLSVLYGPEGFQKEFATLVEALKAARKLRLQREGVHPNPGPPSRSHPRKGHGHTAATRSKKVLPREFRIASFNLGFSLEDKLVREPFEAALEHEEVDIAALQEVSKGETQKLL